jgi:hypothetical protein
MFNLTCKGNEEFPCVFWYFPVCSTETNMEIPCVHEKNRKGDATRTEKFRFPVRSDMHASFFYNHYFFSLTREGQVSPFYFF